MKKGIIGVLGVMAGMAAGAITTAKYTGKATETQETRVDKFKGYYNMLNQWLMLKQEGRTLEKYFTDNGYKTVAIYGMGEMGNRLYDELKKSNEVEVKYGVDKNAAATYSELEVKELDEGLENVDVVVVTATFAFDEIEEDIRAVFDGDIVSLDDVVFEI